MTPNKPACTSLKLIFKFIFLIVIFTNNITILDAEKWKAGIRLYHSEISGVRAFDADHNDNYNLTDTLFVPSIFIQTQLGEKFYISLEHSYLNNIESVGYSGDSSIFDAGGTANSTITDYDFIEDIHETSLSFLYTAWVYNKLSISIGPTISLSFSNTNFAERINIILPNTNFVGTLNRHLRNYTETDVTLGFQTGLEYQSSGNFVTGINYRFSNLPSRDVHLIGVSLGMKW